jgi:hypothetical protein
MQDKLFIGSGKTHERFPDIINASIELNDAIKPYIKTDKNGKKWLNFSVAKRKQADKYGKDWSLSIYTGKPKEAPKAEEAF